MKLEDWANRRTSAPNQRDASRLFFNWKGRNNRHIPIGSVVCAARVITLVQPVLDQLREIWPRFRWRDGFELYVTIIAVEEIDVITGFALTRAGKITRMMLIDASDTVSPAKLREIAKTPPGRPVVSREGVSEGALG